MGLGNLNKQRRDANATINLALLKFSKHTDNSDYQYPYCSSFEHKSKKRHIVEKKEKPSGQEFPW